MRWGALAAPLLLAGLLCAGNAHARRRAHPKGSARPPAEGPAAPASATTSTVSSLRRGASRPGEGRVLEVSAAAAYLDRGAQEGLVRGTALQLLRRGSPAAKCTVVEVSDHHATCAPAGIRTGDTFALPGRTAGTAERAAPPAPLSPAQLEPLRAQLVAAPFPKVDFARQGGGTAGGGVRRLWADLTFTHWGASATADGTFQQERIDLSARGVPLFLGLGLDVDAQAVRWSRRPAAFRFQDASSSRLWVYQAELSRRQVGQSLAFAAGRLWPWNAPGVGALDGLQFGVRSADDQLELGVLGGTQPDPVTLAPTVDRPLGGLYASVRHLDPSGPVRFLEDALRITYGITPESGARLGVEDALRAELGTALSLSAGVRLGYGAVNAPALVELAHLDVQARAEDRFRLGAGLRYVSDPTFAVAAAETGLAGVRGLHGDLTASWDPSANVSLSLTGGYVRDLQTLETRGYVGPELALPHLLGVGGVSLGYLEEPGTGAGRSAYAQVLLAGSTISTFARASWFYDHPAAAASGAAAASDGGLSVSIQWAPVRWLWVRGSFLGRLQLWPAAGEANDSVDGRGQAQPMGLVASATVGGAL